MEILSNKFNIPTNVRNLNQVNQSKNLVNSDYSSQAFKAGKKRIAKEITNDIFKGLEKQNLNKILMGTNDKNKFFDSIGSILNPLIKENNLDLKSISALIVSIAATITELCSSKENNLDSEVIPNIKPKTKKVVKKESKIDKTEREQFKRPPRVHSYKEATNYSKYIESNFKDDDELWNSNVRLYNQYAGYNKDGAHILNEEVCENKTIVGFILNEIINAQGDKDKILEIVNKYAALNPSVLKLETIQNKDNVEDLSKINNDKQKDVAQNEDIVKETSSQSKNSEIKIKINDSIKRALNGKNNLTEAYQAIIKDSKTKEEAERRLESINELMFPWSNKENKELNPDVVKNALQILNQKYSDNLEKIAKIYKENFSSNLYKAQIFYSNLANDKFSRDVITSYNDKIKALGLTFMQYNNLKNSGLNDEQITKIANLIHGKYKDLNDIEIDSWGNMEVKLPIKKSLEDKFCTIKQVFEIAKNQSTGLNALENKPFDKTSLKEELKKDFNSHQNDNGYNYSTYPNLVKFLYGPKHNVWTAESFDKHTWGDHFNSLIEVLNDDEIFDPEIFSNHAKLRFMERFVCSKNFDWNDLSKKTSLRIKDFKDLLNSQLTNGALIETYTIGYDYNDNRIIAPRVVLEDNGAFSLGDGSNIKFTLNNKSQIHTIF